jgi:hypothetical protein
MATWYNVADDPEQARLLGAWPDAPIENLEVCEIILETAQDQVTAYAPAPAPVPSGEPVPDPPARYVYAQLQQARNLWNSGRTTGEGDVGPDGFVFRPYPLDKTIKQIIRPVDGKPHVL